MPEESSSNMLFEGQELRDLIASTPNEIELRNSSPEGFVFPSEKITTPLSPDNLWRRSMYPKLETIGLEWATFQVLRRTNASLGDKHGLDRKVADQRGHGIGVSLDVYTSSDMEQKRAALRKRSNRTSKTARTPVRVSAPGLME